MSNTLSPKVESRLKSAVTMVSSLVDDGVDEPATALKKAAEKYNLLPEQVRVVGRAFNTGRTVTGYEDSDLRQKTATDQLIDIESVIDDLFPTQEKAASVIRLKSHRPRDPRPMYSDYNLSPAQVEASHAPLPKLASVGVDEFESRLKSATLHTKMRRNPLAEVQARVRNEVAEARAQVSSLETAFQEKYAALVSAFGRTGAPPLSEVQENFSLVKGQGASDIFQALAKDIRPWSKAAADNHDVSWDQGSIYHQVLDTWRTKTAIDEAQTKLETLIKDAIEYGAQLVLPDIPRSTSGSLATIDEDRWQKAAAIGGPLMLGAGMEIGKAFPKFKTRKGLVQSKVDRIGSPEHEQEISAIRTRSMLDGLMNTDPILKGYDRAEVVKAYNDISNIAPQSVRNPVYAKALMRKYLEQGGALDPFDLNQLIQSEKAIVDRNMKLMDNLRREESTTA